MKVHLVDVKAPADCSRDGESDSSSTWLVSSVHGLSLLAFHSLQSHDVAGREETSRIWGVQLDKLVLLRDDCALV